MRCSFFWGRGRGEYARGARVRDSPVRIAVEDQLWHSAVRYVTHCVEPRFQQEAHREKPCPGGQFTGHIERRREGRLEDQNCGRGHGCQLGGHGTAQRSAEHDDLLAGVKFARELVRGKRIGIETSF